MPKTRVMLRGWQLQARSLSPARETVSMTLVSIACPAANPAAEAACHPPALP
jgi:hypothetical protein